MTKKKKKTQLYSKKKKKYNTFTKHIFFVHLLLFLMNYIPACSCNDTLRDSKFYDIHLVKMHHNKCIPDTHNASSGSVYGP